MGDNNEIENSGQWEYDYYSFENVENFKNYLVYLNYDFYDIESVTELAANFENLYNEALEQNIIAYVDNDILLATDVNLNSYEIMSNDDGTVLGISPAWSAGKTLDTANSGTHQVITRDAINSIAQSFPNFFLKNSNNVYITQTYSDYPDMKETDYINSWHFYNYNTKGNFWANFFDGHTAKSKFLEHYNNAKNYYPYNRTIAFRELGAAMHYLSDIGTPVHTGDGLESTDTWVYILGALSPAIVLSIYFGDMVGKHGDFESYVDSIDQTYEMNIPSNINYEYYKTANLSSLVETVAANSYSNYKKARGNDNEKYTATSNTLPYIKEVVAGVLYQFAYEMNGTHQSNYDGVMIRGKQSNLYVSSADSAFSNGSYVQLQNFKAASNQIFNLDEWSVNDSLNGANVISPKSNSNKAVDVSNRDTGNGTKIQMYTKNSTDAQFFRLHQSSDSGYYRLQTGNTSFDKVASVKDKSTSIGANIHQWGYADQDNNHWYMDLLKTINVNWKTANEHEAYVQKGQWIYYKLNFTKAGNYKIQTYSNSDTYFELLDSNFNSIGSPSSYDDAGDNQNAKIFTSFNIGTYYLKVRMYSSSSQEGRINLVVTSTNSTSTTNISTTGSSSLSIGVSKVVYIKFTAPSSKTYTFYSEGSYDTYLTLYDNQMKYIDQNDDGGTNLNCKYNYYMTSGQVIYLAIRMYNETVSGVVPFYLL